MKVSFKLSLVLAAILALLAVVFDRLWHLAHLGFIRLLVEGSVAALVTLLVVRWNARMSIANAAAWIKNLRLGLFLPEEESLPKDLFEPLKKEVTYLASSLTAARASAQEEARLRQTAESIWTAERLREHVRTLLQDRPLFVISNREPYSHIRRNKQVDCVVPPSGMVTALEPILRACGGTWIAQATGDADRDVVDAYDRVAVPPEDPAYQLRRLWLTEKEDRGFYYGFANEGLWPLCHIAHTRPVFRSEDWDDYRKVNERFAEVALEEMKGTEEPYVLVQDYHFALLPLMIKEKRPDARVAIFWHIPWPNPESFGICPWQRELLMGMLGADLIGFHIQQHCNNFLDTVDRALESRVHREHFSVTRQGHTTWIKPIPISIAFAPGVSAKSASLLEDPEPPDRIKALGIQARYLGVGVDRIDYTKGIHERFRAIERFLEKNPTYVGDFTFVELGAPSRILIPRYKDLLVDLQAEAERINRRFRTKPWSPIIFLQGQHSHKDIDAYYRAADVCLVTSLHDGMNLVAKEFVAARDNENAALILSRFTGASRELRDAILINPYDIEQVADAIVLALEMDPSERVGRMQRMRRVVRDQNIYRWGAHLITELSEIRIDHRAAVPA